MSSPDIKVSVVVCAWTLQRRDVLWSCLRALAGQSRPAAEVVVVSDNNAELAALVRAEWPSVTVVESEGPRGLSTARNAGISGSAGDIVVFLDDDAVPELDCLARLLEPFDDPQVHVVGGSATPVWPSGRPRWLPPELDWVVGCSYTGQPQVRAEVRNPLGCVMAFTRAALDAAGPFRADVGRVGNDGAGCEETELCIRVRRSLTGARIVLEPGAVVHHHITTDRTTLRYLVSRCVAEGRSKAALSAVLGAEDSLSAERSYVTTVLPRGLARDLRSAARGDMGGLARASTLVVGAGTTAASYCRFTPAARFHRRRFAA